MSEDARPVSYLVIRGNVYGSYGVEYLRLEGPFQYPKWTSVLNNAQGFSKTRAFQWAALENARVAGLLSDGRLYGVIFDGGETVMFDPRSYTASEGVLRAPGVRVEELPRRYRADEIEVSFGGQTFKRSE